MDIANELRSNLYVSYDADGSGKVHRDCPHWDDGFWFSQGPKFSYCSNTLRCGQLWVINCAKSTMIMVNDNLHMREEVANNLLNRIIDSVNLEE